LPFTQLAVGFLVVVQGPLSYLSFSHTKTQFQTLIKFDTHTHTHTHREREREREREQTHTNRERERGWRCQGQKEGVSPPIMAVIAVEGEWWPSGGGCWFEKDKK